MFRLPRMYKCLHRQIDNANSNWKYGLGLHTDNVAGFDWRSTWTGRSNLMEGLCENYALFCISKVSVYLSNFCLFDYSTVYGSPQQLVEGPDVEVYGKEDALGGIDGEAIVNWRLDSDSSRQLGYFKRTDGKQDSISNLMPNCENCKLYTLRPGLKIKDTMYMKPKKFISTADWVKQGWKLNDILQKQGSNDVIFNRRFYVFPVQVGYVPLKGDRQRQLTRILTYNIHVYYTFTYAGLYSESHQ